MGRSQYREHYSEGCIVWSHWPRPWPELIITPRGMMGHSHCPTPRPIWIPIQFVQDPIEIIISLCFLSMNTSTQFYTRYLIGLCICFGVVQCKYTIKWMSLLPKVLGLSLGEKRARNPFLESIVNSRYLYRSRSRSVNTPTRHQNGCQWFRSRSW